MDTNIELMELKSLKRMLEREKFGFQIGKKRHEFLALAITAFDLAEGAGFGMALHAVNERISKLEAEEV